MVILAWLSKGWSDQVVCEGIYINGLIQERRNSSAKALETGVKDKWFWSDLVLCKGQMILEWLGVV